MDPLPDVSVVIVNYNQYNYTSQCLDSIYEAPPQSSFEIILVDNASADDSAELLAAMYPQVTLIRSKNNGGIAGGNNIGIRNGNSRYVLLLNNDTLVSAGSIDRMVKFLDQHPEAGGAGGNLLNPDGSFQSGAWFYPSIYDEFLHLSRLGIKFEQFAQSRRFEEPCEVDWMSTACMLFRRDALEQVGLVDELFFIYSDETDLEYRIWKAGWKIYYLPDVNTIHFGGKSLRPWKSRPLVFRGRLLFFRKHKPWYQELFVRIMYALSCIPKLIFWGFNLLLPERRGRARNELQSHFRILLISLNPKFYTVH